MQKILQQFKNEVHLASIEAFKVQEKIYLCLNYLARIFAWCTATIYIAMETKFAFEAQALLNITSFAVLFLLASIQFSISRYLERCNRQALAQSTFNSGLTMVYAALFDLFDACLDEFIRRFESTFSSALYSYFLYLGSWSITILAAILAVLSIDKFLRTIPKIISKEDLKPINRSVKFKSWPIGSREPRRRKLRTRT